MTIEEAQEFFYLFYSQGLFVVFAFALVISIFLAIATLVKAIDESMGD